MNELEQYRKLKELRKLFEHEIELTKQQRPNFDLEDRNFELKTLAGYKLSQDVAAAAEEYLKTITPAGVSDIQVLAVILWSVTEAVASTLDDQVDIRSAIERALQLYREDLKE